MRQKRERIKDTTTLYYGSEPDMSGFMAPSQFEVEFGKALNWYNSVKSPLDFKKYTITYLKAHNEPKSMLEAIESLDEFEFVAVGKLCRMITKGMEPNEYVSNKLAEKLRKLRASAKALYTNVVKQADDRSKYEKIQDGINARRRSYIAAIENEVENFLLSGKSDFNLKSWISERGLAKTYINDIALKYSKLSEELELVKKNDPYFKEAYSNFSRPRIMALSEFVRNMLSDCNFYLENVKISKARKPRRKKEKSPEKLVSKVKYCLGIPELKIVSVNPEKIVKADQVWLYNTTYRYLTVLNAKPGGLEIRGTSVYNYDEATSMKKKLRKPNEVLPKIASEGKVFLRKFMDTIKCRPQAAKGRLGEDTVILRVY